MTNADRNQTPISLKDPESVLAYIPHALGFQPEDSLVLLILSKEKLEATLRVDLCHNVNGLSEWAHTVSNLVRRVDNATRVVPVIYTPAGTDVSSARYVAIMDNLAVAFMSYAIDVSTGYGVADKVFEYSASEYLDIDLNNVKFHPVSVQLVSNGSAPRERQWDATNVPVWGNIEQVRALVSESDFPVPEYFSSWGLVLADKEPEALLADVQLCSKLLNGLKYKVVRDLVPYLAGMGEINMMQAYADLTAGMPNDFGDFMLGKTTHAPDWERIDRLDTVARYLLGGAVSGERHALMTLIAWIEWARGRGSMATALLDQVIAEDASYGLADLLKRMMNGGIVPDWATDSARAWRSTYKQ
ncbi:DUF4192 family protein [Glutamicibacter ardleyensis]|uniref:DUF4192 family protein n=1 Tax=Glutamicibacter ardleyensis TaxID=225894 RepID=UPI003FCFC911